MNLCLRPDYNIKRSYDYNNPLAYKKLKTQISNVGDDIQRLKPIASAECKVVHHFGELVVTDLN